MGIAELFLIALGLSMDAFAVSVCKGLSLGKINIKHMCTAGVWFGGFQALMPLTGYFLGRSFADMITHLDHWIAFILLLAIGGNMVRESFGDAEHLNAAMDIKTMFPLALATSIDALAVGVTFAFMRISIIPAVCLIGATTFVCSGAGIKIGSIFGMRYKTKSEFLGGVILIAIGLKILLEGIGVL